MADIIQVSYAPGYVIECGETFTTAFSIKEGETPEAAIRRVAVTMATRECSDEQARFVPCPCWEHGAGSLYFGETEMYLIHTEELDSYVGAIGGYDDNCPVTVDFQ